jgi:uncharacterized membrane protein
MWTGAILLGVGFVLLLGQLTGQPLYAMLALGSAFLVAYLASREYGFLVPGGILTGLGVGILAIVEREGSPGLFLVSFGIGFVAIWVLDRLYTRASNWWPLVPGGVLIAVGLALWQGGAAMDLLTTAGQWWPVILIAVGAWLLYDLWRDRSKPEPPDGTDQLSDDVGSTK